MYLYCEFHYGYIIIKQDVETQKNYINPQAWKQNISEMNIFNRFIEYFGINTSFLVKKLIFVRYTGRILSPIMSFQTFVSHDTFLCTQDFFR